MKAFRSTFSALAVGLFLAACGGDDGPTAPIDDNDDDLGGGAPVILDSPSYSQNIWEIYQRRGCTTSGCHGGGAGGLTMSTAANSYANMVGVASTGTGEILIVAGDAANSYLVKKLEGTQTAGSRMPLGANPLNNVDLTNIKNWINQGAQNN